MAENQIVRSRAIINSSDYDIESTYARLMGNLHYDDDGCMLSQYGLNKSGFTSKKVFGDNNEIFTIDIEKGYPKLRLPGHGANVFAHHVSYVYHNRAIRFTPAFLEMWDNPAYDISHRCGKPRCFASACLIIEHHDQNTTRDYCHGLNKSDICPHNPPCKTRSL
jgi:hypothetical protein